jgi:hypothetical protein
MPNAPWSFNNLNLSDVSAQRVSQGLPVGRHVCVLNHAELKPSKSGIQIILYWAEIEGLGLCRDYITLHSNSNEEGPKMAERIGKERFKAVLESGNHPNPNNPSDIRSLPGMVVGVIVEQDEDWIDDTGRTRKGGTKPRKNGAYIKASELGYDGPLKVSTTHSAAASPAPKTAPRREPATADLDDEIPF